MNIAATLLGRGRASERQRLLYELEREWARRIKSAEPGERHRLYTEIYDAYYRAAAGSAEGVAARHDLELQTGLLAPYLTPETVLVEVGGGDGRLAAALAPKIAAVMLVEASGVPVREDELPANVTLVLSPEIAVPIAAGGADVAYSCHLLEHLHPDDAVSYLREMYRILKPGGVLICVTPNRLLGPHDASRPFDRQATALHLCEYDHRQLAAGLGEVGFIELRAVGAPGRAASQATLERSLRWERRLEALPAALRRLLLSLGRRRPLRRLEQVVLVASRPRKPQHLATRGCPQTVSAPAARHDDPQPEPFLHVDAGQIYNPLTDRTLARGDPLHRELRPLLERPARARELEPAVRDLLLAEGWLRPASDRSADRFRLRFVSIEGNTVCNQACSFCPVSVAPRPAATMSLELFSRICDQLVELRSTLEAVFLHNYNEPTSDRFFLERVRVLKERALPVAVNTNASGLTPERIDALVEMGGLDHLAINLTTLDRERYQEERRADHLDRVLRNLDYAGRLPVAGRMVVTVLGHGDSAHTRELSAVRRRLSGSRFEIEAHRLHDRAGALPSGLRRDPPVARLRGCSDLGSRPLQHLHITAEGTCVLCCQDYYERHPLGDLRTQTVRDVLTGPQAARLRRWVYGLELAPEDFLCRRCHHARCA